MKKIVSFVLACIFALGLCACSGEPTLVGTAPAGEITEETPVVGEEKTFKPGDMVELNGVVVTFVDVIESMGEQFFEPGEGNVFVLCEFEIANNSEEEVNVSSIMSFEAYCDGYACDYSFNALMAKGDKDQLDGTVAPGKKMKGVVGYEVSADWAELEVQYTLDVWDDDKIVFVATNN